MTSVAQSRVSMSNVRTVTDLVVQASEVEGERTAYTFIDYETSKDGVAWALTVAELHRRIRAVAVWLADRCEPGDRVAILAPQGLEYVLGFLGAMHAGMIAVPLFPPDPSGYSDRLDSVLADCEPACALTAKSTFDVVRELLGQRGGNMPCLAVDTLPDSVGADYVAPDTKPDDIAYLQYTSGSTRTPAGVEITHTNAVVNARDGYEAYTRDFSDTSELLTLSWLPLFHDMGLVLSITAPLAGGVPSVLFDPMAFLQQPSRWLRLLSANPGAITAAPNFAYDFCASRVTEAEKAWLQLDDVAVFGNGSEPLQPATIHRFNEAFAECGVTEEMHRPTYGLAEAVVFVTTTAGTSAPRMVPFNRELLGQGIASAVTDSETTASELVSCGIPAGQQWVAVVDPATCVVLDESTVGEVWVHGQNTGRGYWGQDRAVTAETFAASIAHPVEGYPDSGWLRTGDLGAWYEGGLYITGRMKDLIIVDGRNHYPQDVEAVTETAHAGVRKHHTAAFSIDTDRGEQLVVVAEYSRKIAVEDRDSRDIIRTVSAAVSSEQGVSPHDVVLVEPDVVPRTSSGKVARRQCRERYLHNELTKEG